MIDARVKTSHKTPAIEKTSVLYISQLILVTNIVLRTKDVFLFPYARVDKIFAMIIRMLFKPCHVANPKMKNNILNKIMLWTVLLFFLTCFVNIIFLTHPTRFIAIPVYAPIKKY